MTNWDLLGLLPHLLTLYVLWTVRRMLLVFQRERVERERPRLDTQLVLAALDWADDKKGSKEKLREAVRVYREGRPLPQGSQIFIPTPRVVTDAKPEE